MINAADQHVLIQAAWNAIVATVTGQSHQPPTPSGELTRPAAAFVSLHCEGQLRGCIGHLEEDGQLLQTIAECAQLACTSDPRFPSVTAAELDRLEVEISVLGPFERIMSVVEIEI